VEVRIVRRVGTVARDAETVDERAGQYRMVERVEGVKKKKGPL
jgi:hypothetical protein